MNKKLTILYFSDNLDLFFKEIRKYHNREKKFYYVVDIREKTIVLIDNVYGYKLSKNELDFLKLYGLLFTNNLEFHMIPEG